MRIAWIADYLLKEHLGGAQQTNARIIDYGRKLGHEIIEYTAKDLDMAMAVDLMITNNITTFNIEDIKRLMDRIPTIRYDHDIWCSLERPEIFDGTIQNIFLSPWHQEKVGLNIGKAIEGVCIPSPIDVKVFNKDNAVKEENTVLWVGSTAPHKGLDKLIAYAQQNPTKKVRVVSFDCPKESLASNIEIIGEKHGAELADIYRRSEIYFHHPDHEAFGRTVMEAYLCGCKLDLNDNVGAMSYDWDYNNYEEVKSHLQSEGKFWREIEKAMDKLEKI